MEAVKDVHLLKRNPIIEDERWTLNFKESGKVANMARVLSMTLDYVFYINTFSIPHLVKSIKPKMLLGQIENFPDLTFFRILTLDIAKKKEKELPETLGILLENIRKNLDHNIQIKLFKEFLSYGDSVDEIEKFFTDLKNTLNLLEKSSPATKQNYIFGLILSLEKKKINAYEDNLKLQSIIKEILLELLYSLYLQSWNEEVEINELISIGSHFEATKIFDQFLENRGGSETSTLGNRLSIRNMARLNMLVTQISGKTTYEHIRNFYRSKCVLSRSCSVLDCNNALPFCTVHPTVEIVEMLDGAVTSEKGNPLIGEQISVLTIEMLDENKSIVALINDHHDEQALNLNAESTSLKNHRINSSIIELAQTRYSQIKHLSQYQSRFDNKSPLRMLFEQLNINPEHECAYVKYEVGEKKLFAPTDININMPDPDTCFPIAESMLSRSIINSIDAVSFSLTDPLKYVNDLWANIDLSIRQSTTILDEDLVFAVMSDLGIEDPNINPSYIVNTIVDLVEAHKVTNKIEIKNAIGQLTINYPIGSNREAFKTKLEAIVEKTTLTAINLGYPKNQNSMDIRCLESIKTAFYLACKNLDQAENKLEAFFKITKNLAVRLETVNRGISIIDANSGTTVVSKLAEISKKFVFPKLNDSLNPDLDAAQLFHAIFDSLHNYQLPVMRLYYKSDILRSQTSVIRSSWELLGQGFEMTDEHGNLNFDQFDKFITETTGKKLQILSGNPDYEIFQLSDDGNTSPIVFYDPAQQSDKSIDLGQIRTLISLETNPSIIICCASRTNGMIAHWNYTIFTTDPKETKNVKRFSEFASKVAGYVCGHDGKELENFFGPGGGVKGCRNVGYPFDSEIMKELIHWYIKIEVNKPEWYDPNSENEHEFFGYKKDRKEFFEWMYRLQNRAVKSILNQYRCSENQIKNNQSIPEPV